MKCQHCQTAITSPRAKNCPACSEILSDAHRRGAYGFVMEAIAAARADGHAGAEMRQLMADALRAGQQQRAAWLAQYRESQKQKAAARSEELRFFEQHGYWPGSRPEEDARIDIEISAAEDERPRADRYGDLGEEDLARRGL